MTQTASTEPTPGISSGEPHPEGLVPVGPVSISSQDAVDTRAMDLEADLRQLEADARTRISAASDEATLHDVERSFLGKGGSLAALLAKIPELPAEQRPGFGKTTNLLKQAIVGLVTARRNELEAASAAAALATHFDVTLPAAKGLRGSLHPVTQIVREVEDLFVSMGYRVLDGPEVETDFFNFQALNIPEDHPARDAQDTFYCEPLGQEKLVLRTHTSPVQVRSMQHLKPPFRVIAPGKVFRNEATDASHEHTFHQLEGLVIDRNVNVGHLVGAMKTLLRGIFDRELDVRLRPGYFPFVEPGFELDARCPFCSTGCSVCKGTRWVELFPAAWCTRTCS
jgi:phenylalanyl-tRNA synthetase alpha chain